MNASRPRLALRQVSAPAPAPGGSLATRLDPGRKPSEPSAAWNLLLRLVGNCCRGKTELLAGLSEPEWADLLVEADLHALTPFLYRALAPERARLAVPAQVWRGFKKMYLFSRARTRRLHALVLPVLSALSAARIPVIALKGMHLANQAYGDPAERLMMDADIMVPRRDLASAAKLVETFGFRPSDAEGPARPFNDMWPDDDQHHLPLFRRPDGPPIEIHYAIEPPNAWPGIDTGGLWERSLPVRIGPAAVRVLSPEDTLLHLCVHAASHHHFMLKLLSLCDVPVAIRCWGERIAWDLLWARARAWGVEEDVALTLGLVVFRMDYPLPDRAAAPLAPFLGFIAQQMPFAECNMQETAVILAERLVALVERRSGGRPTLAPAPAR